MLKDEREIDNYVSRILAFSKYEENEDGTWTAVILPDVTYGIVTFGETKEEARKMLEDAVRAWVLTALAFGDELPEIPKSEEQSYGNE